jgi:hypothetical protein
VEPHHFAGAGAEIFVPAPAPVSKNHIKFHQHYQLLTENCMPNIKIIFFIKKELFTGICNFVLLFNLNHF